MLGFVVWDGRFFCSFLLADFFVCFHLVPSYIRQVYFLEPLGSFLIIILFFTDKKNIIRSNVHEW